MNLTGKCKESFEKWLCKLPRYEYYTNEYILTLWDNYSESMQYGVLVDFFDSVGISISIYSPSLGFFETWVKGHCIYDGVSRPEARTKAIEKANEIFNK